MPTVDGYLSKLQTDGRYRFGKDGGKTNGLIKHERAKSLPSDSTDKRLSTDRLPLPATGSNRHYTIKPTAPSRRLDSTNNSQQFMNAK